MGNLARSVTQRGCRAQLLLEGRKDLDGGGAEMLELGLAVCVRLRTRMLADAFA